MLHKIGAFLSGPSGILLIILFFLPWVNVSCTVPGAGNSEIVSASGFEMATGDAYDEANTNLTGGMIDDPMLEDQIEIGEGNPFEVLDADASLWLILLIAVLMIGVAAAHYLDFINALIAGTAYTLGGIVGLAVFALKWRDLGTLVDEIDKLNQDAMAEAASDGTDTAALGFDFTVAPLSFSYEFAFYLTAIVLAMFLVAGIGVIMAAPSSKAPSQGPAMPNLDILTGRGNPPPTSGQSSGGGAPKRPSWFDDPE